MKIALNSSVKTVNNYERIENIVESSNTGLNNKETEDLMVRLILS